MSSPNHPTSNIEDAFSSNFPDYIPASPDYSPASPGNTYSSSSNNSFGLVPIASPTLSLFHDDPYMKVMQAYYAKKSPIPPPTIVPPSSMLSLMGQEVADDRHGPRYLSGNIPSEERKPDKSKKIGKSILNTGNKMVGRRHHSVNNPALSKVEGCGGLRGSRLTTSDKEVTKQDLVLKGDDIGACKLVGDVMVMLERW
ncbi:hypothetical protein Tco_1232467 [Tanacetum coccineum]